MARSLKAVLDESNPNKLASAGQSVLLGSCLGTLPVLARGTVGGVTANTLILPENAKARSIVAGFAVAGSVTGPLVPQNRQGTTPTTTQVAIDKNGDLVFFGTDAITSAEVSYIPYEGQIIEDFVQVIGGVATLLGSRKAFQLLFANVIAGVATGVKGQNLRGAAASSGFAALSLVGTTVAFNAADVVTGSARIRYIAQPGVGNGVVASQYDRLNASQSAL